MDWHLLINSSFALLFFFLSYNFPLKREEDGFQPLGFFCLPWCFVVVVVCLGVVWWWVFCCSFGGFWLFVEVWGFCVLVGFWVFFNKRMKATDIKTST